MLYSFDFIIINLMIFDQIKSISYQAGTIQNVEQIKGMDTFPQRMLTLGLQTMALLLVYGFCFTSRNACKRLEIISLKAF